VGQADVPEEIRELAERRERARQARDFASADDLREQIRRGGFEVTDTPSGPVFQAFPPEPLAQTRAGQVIRPQEVPSMLEEPPITDVSIQWVVQGWPEDVRRGIEAFDRHSAGHGVQHVVVDLLEERTDWRPNTDVVRLPKDVGWGAARNAGLLRSAGHVVVVADGSVEPVGDVLGPLIAALEDPTVGVTGPFGIATHDLHDFHQSDGPDVDAVEGYLMALRRDLVRDGLRFDEKFRFYRTADIELSFQIKARGLRATVTSVPVRKHQHRMWAATPEDERARLSKRNFYRFLDRWRGRTDLLVVPGD